MSANSSDIAVGSIQILGNHQFKIIRQIGEGSTGLAYKAYLMKGGVADEGQPFAIKVDKSDYFILREFRLKKLLEKRQKEAQKQSHEFESVVYRIGNRIVTLMPMLPGQPIFDEYGMPHPHLVSLTLSERLELAALVVQTYLEFHADGLFHVDLNWENVLIYIERLKGKAYFQCNIIDFTNNSKYVALIGAPEYNSSLFFPTPSIKSDIYSLTFLIAIILGETNVFKNKLPYKFGSKAAEFPFYLEGMKSYLRDEYSKLSNNGKPEEPTDTFAMPEEPPDTFAMPEEPPDILVKPEEPPDIHAKAEEPTDIHAKAEEPPDIHAKAEEPTDILVKPDRIIEDVIDTVTKMGSNEPEHRPDEFKIVEALIKASLACRKMEMKLTESDLTTEIAEVGVKQKKEFYNEPIRNHLLATAGIGMWAKPNQSLRVDDRQGRREISAFRS